MGGIGDGHRDRFERETIERTRREIDNENAAIRWPKLMNALGNLPPTRVEIENILLNGYPDGYSEPPKKNGESRWEYRFGHSWVGRGMR